MNDPIKLHALMRAYAELSPEARFFVDHAIRQGRSAAWDLACTRRPEVQTFRALWMDLDIDDHAHDVAKAHRPTCCTFHATQGPAEQPCGGA